MTDRWTDSSLAVEPYVDSTDHIRDALERLDILLRYHLETWWAAGDGVVDELRGLYVSDETVDVLFPADVAGRVRSDEANGAGTGERPPPNPDLLVTVDERADIVAARVRRTLAAGTDLRLAHLADQFDLSAADVDALLLAFAPTHDARYETLYSYLHDDVTAKRPTIGLVCTVLARDGDESAVLRRLFARGGPLRRHNLLRLRESDERPLRSRPVTVDERIAEYLLGADDVDPELDGVAELVVADDVSADGSDLTRTLGLSTCARTALDRLLDAESDHRVRNSNPLPDPDSRTRGESRPPMAYAWGPRGSGRHAVAAAVSRSRARDAALLAIDASQLTDAPLGLSTTLARVGREGLLRGAALSVRNFDSLSHDERERLAGAVDEFPGPVVLSGGTEWQPQTPPSTHVFTALALSVPGTEARRRLWRAALASTGVGDDEADALASKFRLTSGAIRDAVETARQTTDGEEPSVAALYDACRHQAGGSLTDLAQAVPQPYAWEDIVLPPEQMVQLREVAAHVAHRGTVYDDWGFAERYAAGTGLIALFSGPSGTGKTMAASIVAREAGLDLYRVDLSSVVSKYVGETEKNLGRVFDEAGKGDAVLLFDEADALFGKRSEVRDAHDRYANVEVNYLLQRVEAYDGVVVLTTNFKRNIDEAFTRRIHLCVEFPRPTRAAREGIWRSVFPPETPVEELDFEFLSTLELTGGNVKNAALTAAFMAADAGESVRMAHVVKAVKRELQKTGTLVSPEAFGNYWEDPT
ncbi:ATP-binding protein [Halogeometricum sp. S1BR25-6]|uniref:ATP-binding protein n=1 Tax=Halogeometricum salsisoli TaxID=2950536 RepID=A0ABU2GJY0_9EURY|nr:ATP-binding protein [Halogeometricum sp. S1BR25-6]MDS0301127.1 ATP-binding protein [Halogeometricum sp. S1BR25-6]